MGVYAALAVVVLCLHLVWCAWVLLGWMLTRRRRFLRLLHIGSLIYAIIIELAPWPPCPLTAAEMWLEARGDVVTTRGPFLMRLLEMIVYPDLPEWLVVGGAVTVCLAILGIHARHYLRPSVGGASDPA